MESNGRKLTSGCPSNPRPAVFDHCVDRRLCSHLNDMMLHACLKRRLVHGVRCVTR